MGKINWSRVILGGIVAGIVADVLGFLVDGVILAPRWFAGMRALGHPGMSTSEMIGYELVGIAMGLIAIWLYAAIRPRYGKGVKTAICAGLAVWALAGLLPNLCFMVIPHLFSRHLALYTTAGFLVEIVVATIVGAALYKEPPASATVETIQTQQSAHA